jgi:hypothetical protein
MCKIKKDQELTFHPKYQQLFFSCTWVKFLPLNQETISHQVTSYISFIVCDIVRRSQKYCCRKQLQCGELKLGAVRPSRRHIHLMLRRLRIHRCSHIGLSVGAHIHGTWLRLLGLIGLVGGNLRLIDHLSIHWSHMILFDIDYLALMWSRGLRLWLLADLMTLMLNCLLMCHLVFLYVLGNHFHALMVANHGCPSILVIFLLPFNRVLI